MLGNNRFVPLHAVQNIEKKLLCLSSYRIIEINFCTYLSWSPKLITLVPLGLWCVIGFCL